METRSQCSRPASAFATASADGRSWRYWERRGHQVVEQADPVQVGLPLAHDALAEAVDLFVTQAPLLARRLQQRCAAGQPPSGMALALLRRTAQTRAESRNRDARDATLKQDRRYARVLAFAGRGE